MKINDNSVLHYFVKKESCGRLNSERSKKTVKGQRKGDPYALVSLHSTCRKLGKCKEGCGAQFKKS